MTKNVAIGYEFHAQICEAVGIDPENVHKVIVEATAGEPIVSVYIELIGDERLLRVDWAGNADKLKVVKPNKPKTPTIVIDGDPIPLEHLSNTSLHYLYADGGQTCPFCEEGTIAKDGTCPKCGENVFAWYRARMSRMASDARRDITVHEGPERPK